MSAPTTYTHRVYSEGHAGRYAKSRLVRGNSIYCPTLADAQRIARNIAAGLGGEAIVVTTDDGAYYYATQEDADDDGASAAAAIYALDADEIDALAREARQ